MCRGVLPLSPQDDHGTLRYLDTSTGQPVAEIKTKLGALKTLAQNPRNGVVQLGHFNGCVSLWSPNVSSPLAKLQCHRGPLTSLAVDQAGHCLITAAMDAKMKVAQCACLPLNSTASSDVSLSLSLCVSRCGTCGCIVLCTLTPPSARRCVWTSVGGACWLWVGASRWRCGEVH